MLRWNFRTKMIWSGQGVSIISFRHGFKKTGDKAKMMMVKLCDAIIFAGLLWMCSMEQTKTLSYIELFWRTTGANCSNLSKHWQMWVIVVFFTGNLSQCSWLKGQGDFFSQDSATNKDENRTWMVPKESLSFVFNLFHPVLDWVTKAAKTQSTLFATLGMRQGWKICFT